MHPEFAVHVTTTMAASPPLLVVPELLPVVPPLELPLELPEPLELPFPVPLFELLQPKTVAAATETTTPTTRTIFIGFSSLNPEVPSLTAPTPLASTHTRPNQASIASTPRRPTGMPRFGAVGCLLDQRSVTYGSRALSIDGMGAAFPLLREGASQMAGAKSLGAVGALISGSLVVAVACSSSSPTGGGPQDASTMDSGGSGDDSGMVLDTGAPVEAGMHPKAIGSPCLADTDCATGLTCNMTFPGGMCTKACAGDGDCMGRGGSVGACIMMLCFAACPGPDAGVLTEAGTPKAPCKNKAFDCEPITGHTPTYACLPNAEAGAGDGGGDDGGGMDSSAADSTTGDAPAD
jgi:hypothetical protein